jgi:hypothetical protein
LAQIALLIQAKHPGDVALKINAWRQMTCRQGDSLEFSMDELRVCLDNPEALDSSPCKAAPTWRGNKECRKIDEA